MKIKPPSSKEILKEKNSKIKFATDSLFSLLCEQMNQKEKSDKYDIHNSVIFSDDNKELLEIYKKYQMRIHFNLVRKFQKHGWELTGGYTSHWWEFKAIKRPFNYNETVIGCLCLIAALLVMAICAAIVEIF